MEKSAAIAPAPGTELTGYVIDISYNQVVLETDEGYTAYFPFSEVDNERNGIYQGEEINGYVKYVDDEISSLLLGITNEDLPEDEKNDAVGDFYHAAEAYEKAMVFYKKALEMKEAALKTASDEEEVYKLRAAVAFSCKSLGELCADMNDLPAAVANYKKGFDILRDLPPTEELISFAARIGDILEDMEDYEGAIEYTFEACQYEADRGAAMMNMGQRPDTDQSESMANHLMKLGDLYGKTGDKEEQLQAYGNALTFFSSVVEERGTVRDFYVLAEINYRIGDLSGDANYLGEAIDSLEVMVQEYPDLPELKEALDRAKARFDEV